MNKLNVQPTRKHPLKGAVITLDGPSASGKGTLAKRLSRRFLMKYLDTGTLYRALTFAALKADISIEDEKGLAALVPKMDFDFRHVGNNVFETFLDGVSIEVEIRAPAVDKNVRFVAAHLKVRDALRDFQISFAETWKDVYGVVLDGRDTGSRIYPNAQFQFFVVGDINIRAHRRFLQMQEAGETVSETDVLEQLQRRDTRDAVNTIQTPLAHILDVTHDSADEIEAQALAVIKKERPLI